MYKIGVMGSRDTVIGFKALGLDAYPVDNSEQAKQILRELCAPDSNYAIIYLEENLAEALKPQIDRVKELPSPAIILIPGREGSLGLGMRELYEAVDKAVGVAII